MPVICTFMSEINSSAKQFKDIAGGLAAASFVVVTQVCTRDLLDLPLTICVWIFAVTTPLLVALFLGVSGIGWDV
jgi:ABC-type arginine/histidine transport system permease subunit